MVLSKFDSLSLRPPTPPKDLEDNDEDVDETLRFLDDPFGEKPALPNIAATKALLNTPVQSPSSDISIPSSSASRTKRVNFELQTCAIASKKAIVQSWTPTRSSPLRPLPQTRVSKPLKSILKPSDSTPTPPPAEEGAAAHKFKTFAEMLESIVKLLASAERSSRLDAYHSLQRTMQAYDKIPDDQALKHKMSLLTQFIRRDVQAPSVNGTGLDSQLIAQALKLLMALFRITELTSAMDDDFCSFIVERIIHIASDESMPKTIVNTHLAVLMQQSFRPRAMTTARVERILDVLDTIHERVSGFSVQAYRVRIYRKLIQQRPDIMIKHTERWFKHTVKALVSGQKDINQSALDTALFAAKTIGHDRHVAKSVLSVLNRVRNDGETLARVMTKELERMLSGDNAAMVPQIWAAVTGLLRDSLHGQSFSAMKDWLEVFEKCLRSEKELVKVHANIAFCFLLYAVNLAPNSSEGWTKMFLNIPLHQLQRRIPVRKSERDAITSGYITLLYYAFRPTAPFDQLDRYWTEFVSGFWYPLIHSSSTQQAVAACRVVSALLNGSRKPWNEHRALDLRSQYMIQRSELPLLDPKWVRKSLPLVLQFVETLLDATSWSENEQQEDEPVKVMWLALLDSLVEASSKEVMASSETKDAMAHMINLLRRLWDRHTAKLALPQQKEDLWANKFCFLVETVVQKLGAFQFADKCLTRNGDNDFEVASTPSHRTRQQGARISPLLYLIDLLVNQSEGKLADTIRLRAMKLIIEPCFNIQNTRLSRLDLLRDCAATVNGSSSGAVALDFWAQLAALLRSAIQEHITDPNERVSRSFGKEYETVVDLLGLGSAYMLNTPRGLEILSALIDTVRGEAGEGALIIAVIERVSECVLKRTMEDEKTSCLGYTSMLLRNLPHQMSRRVLDQGRQNLWPSSPAAGRSMDFDPYNHLYGAIVSVGCAAYRDINTEDVEPTKHFLAALSLSIHHSQTSHLAVYLRKTQEVLRLWVEDPERKLQSKDQPSKILHLEVTNMWSEISKAIERLPRKDGQILVHLESLITAGFLSRRRNIVNISVTTWNNTFGKEQSLRYPPNLAKALRRLRTTVELSLPSFEERDVTTGNEISFYDSDSSAEDIAQTFKDPRGKQAPFKISKATRRSTSRSPALSSVGSRRQSARLTPKVRLRHDNSQIQFEPIVSSPSNPFNQESQVLTERQREVIERQRLTTGLFANIGAVSSQSDAVPSPMEMHSDALSADDLLNHASQTTPLKALASMGPMDVFLGSSPTPHARKSTQTIVSDDTSVATPTAVRTLHVTNDDLGSSPPRFEKDVNLNTEQLDSAIRAGSTFDYRQSESSQSISFDEGTTIDDEAILEAVATQHNDSELSVNDIFMGTAMLEVPSPNIDFQLTAQIDADMQAQVAAAIQSTEEEEVPELSTDLLGDDSHQLSPTIDTNRAGRDPEVENSQLETYHTLVRSYKEPEADPSSTSRIGDSFNNAASEAGTPNTRSLRRSSRRSTASSPAQSTSGKKRKQTPAKSHNKTNDVSKEDHLEKAGPPAPIDDDDMLDNIVVVSPKKKDTSKKRKSMNNTQALTDHVVVPETNRKRGVLRSQSLLSQVENSQDFLVEDTPAPKRARQSVSRDVSEAKNASPTQASQSKRLSHVQVTPKRSSECGSPAQDSSTSKDLETTVHLTDEETTVVAREMAEQSQAQSTLIESNTPSRSFTERVILTPRSIINQLKSLKDYLFSAPQLVLGREEEREIDDALFDIRRQVHAAGQRTHDQGQ
ncbi:Rap1-interacting factor 1 N terminal-domain-containing protein [Pyrenochaeta sp. MPI-SDFR-AT-0127]|nr:Rap1-interacting factor 1 N terminal-domain-containing protein [Pyrenochaeta sp. MPI-SDFR-AT-0127]